VLVCDDGSTDDTRNVVASFSGRLALRYEWSENSGGAARPRNIGLSLARGEYVAFLDSDDWWLPRKLEVAVQHLTRGADIVYHELYAADNRSRRFFKRRVRARRVAQPVLDDLIMNGNALNTSSVVVRSELLRQVGGFSEDPRQVFGEDYDCWLRLAGLTQKFEYISSVLGYYWAGGGNITNPERSLMGFERLRDVHFRTFARAKGTSEPAWIRFKLAQLLYDRGSYREAEAHLSGISGPVPIAMRIRIALMLLQMRLRALR
jgi:glycosyltransferase involved in cell wall biosynthesis